MFFSVSLQNYWQKHSEENNLAKNAANLLTSKNNCLRPIISAIKKEKNNIND